MADVFELELHDLQEDDPNRAPDSDDDIIEVDEVNIPYFIHTFIRNLFISLQCECAARAKKVSFYNEKSIAIKFWFDANFIDFAIFTFNIFQKTGEREKKHWTNYKELETCTIYTCKCVSVYR